MEKHDGTFLQQASLGEPVAVRGTNRSVETGIGKTKNQLKRNPKTRALLLQAKLQLKKKARVLHSAMPTSLSFEMGIADLSKWTTWPSTSGWRAS